MKKNSPCFTPNAARPVLAGSLMLMMLTGCVPRIEVAAPKEPITINMNVRIEHDITIRADKEATQILQNAENGVSEEVGKGRVETTTREQTRTETRSQNAESQP